MENKNNEKNNAVKMPKGIQNLMNTVQSSIERLYQNTHMTSYVNNNDIDVIRDKMNNAINGISNRNMDNTGNSSLSMLIKNNSDMRERLMGTNNISNQAKDIEDMFNDKQFTDNFTMMLDDNKAIKEFDDEIDIILKYFPLLNEALDAKKDTVLSADNNTKDYLHFQSDTASDVDLFNNRIKSIKKTYKLLEEFENIYDKIAKYGECFYYVVPYNKAFKKLLNNRKGQGLTYANESMYSQNNISNGIIKFDVNLESENIVIKNDKISSKYNETMKDSKDILGFSDFKLEMNVTGVLEGVVDDYTNTEKFKSKLQNHILSDKDIEKSKDIFAAPDGLVNAKKTIKDNYTEQDFHVNGAIVKEIKRENIIPIYVDNMCLGYYFIECEFDTFFNRRSSFNSITGKNRNLLQENDKREKRDLMINKLSSVLSKHIDASFINNHQDIKDQLYMILNHNDINNERKLTSVKVTYLPPSDVEHMYFELDKDTHRGISDLHNSLVPAKLYISILINTALGILTRSYDKRVYYVKQSVDTNISATVQNVLNQIKKGNFGTREMSSIKNILGITGRFSDYIIPMTAGGESPIQMEVMNGQQIDAHEDYLQKLEQQAIEATDIPYEFVQSGKQVDYAIRLTMANGKMLRKSFRRQSQVEEFGSRLITKLYTYEFGEEENVDLILPPPTLLSINNMNNILQNIDQTVESILQMEISDNDDPELRRIMKKKLMRYHLSTYLDVSVVDRIRVEAENEFKAQQKPQEQ